MTGLLDLISDIETKNKTWKNNSAHLWIDVQSLSCAIISSTWSGVTNKHTDKKRNEMWRGERNNTLNRSAKRKIVNNRCNKLRTDHYFIDGVGGGGGGGEIGQFPNTKSCTAKSAGKKIVKGEPREKMKKKYTLLSGAPASVQYVPARTLEECRTALMKTCQELHSHLFHSFNLRGRRLAHRLEYV